MALVRPHWRHSGVVHGCPRCTLAAAAGPQVHNLHARPATCQDIAATLVAGEHPQVALIAIALQLHQGTLALQGFRRFSPQRSSAVAPEVGLVAFCAPFDPAASASGGPALSPILPAPGAFASLLLDLFLTAARTHGAAEPDELLPFLPSLSLFCATSSRGPVTGPTLLVVSLSLFV